MGCVPLHTCVEADVGWERDWRPNELEVGMSGVRELEDTRL